MNVDELCPGFEVVRMSALGRGFEILISRSFEQGGPLSVSRRRVGGGRIKETLIRRFVNNILVFGSRRGLVCTDRSTCQILNRLGRTRSSRSPVPDRV